MTDKSDDRVRDQVIEHEAQRCRALVAGDIDALDSLLADDLLHVHANGKADDKAAYLATVRDKVRFLLAERDCLEVRVHLPIVILTGLLKQTIEATTTGQRTDMHVMAMQVWRQEADSWRQESYQAINL